MRRSRRSSRTRTRPTPSPPLRMGRANARRRRRERARRGGGSFYPRGRRDREAPRRREGARGREGRRPSCEVRSVFPPVARRESNPEARRRRSAGRWRAAIDAMRAMGRGRSRSVRRVVSRASRRALPRREERQTGLTSAAAIRKSRPRSARGALSLADAEPSIDESNIPMKILPGRSIRNLRKARQRAIKCGWRKGGARRTRGYDTRPSAPDVFARSRPHGRVRVFPSGKSSAPSRRWPPAPLFPPTPTISAAETAATPMRTKAQQMLRKASVFLGKASREVRIPSIRPPARLPRDGTESRRPRDGHVPPRGVC